MADGVLSEVRAGLRAAGPYLLSHHEPDEWHRCYEVTVPVDGRTIRLCARCAGVYPGVAAGALAAVCGVVPVGPLLVAVLPAFALAEWTVTAYSDLGGTNVTRTATGAALGVGYGVGLVALTDVGTRVPVLAVGVGYAVAAAGLLYWRVRGE